MSRWALIVVVAVVPCLAADAVADVHTVVAPAAADKADAGTVAAVNAALLRVASELSPSAALGKVSLSDVAFVSGCSLEERSCRKAVVRSLRATRVLSAMVRPDAPQLAFEVVLVSTDGTKSAAPTDSAESTDVEAAARALLGGVASEPPAPAPPAGGVGETRGAARRPAEAADSPARVGEVPPASRDARFASAPASADPPRRRLATMTWAVLAAGGAPLATGVVFFALASSKQAEIDSAPTESLADLRRLIELEDSARLRSTVGAVFIGAGLAAVAVGGVMAYRDTRRQAPSVSVEVGPTAVVLVYGGSL